MTNKNSVKELNYGRDRYHSKYKDTSEIDKRMELKDKF